MSKYLRALRTEVALVVKAKELLILEKLKNSLADATPVDTGEAKSGWKIINGKIVNDVEHLSNLNAGSSRQAPAFFIEKTVLQSPDIKPSGAIVTYINAPKE